MGRREIEVTTKRAVRTCDRCDRDLGGISPNHCRVCKRELDRLKAAVEGLKGEGKVVDK